MGSACYYSVEKLLSSSLLSKNLKVRIYKTVILPVVLYGCKTWTLTLREQHRLRVSENKVLWKIFGAKRDEVTGEWRKLHNTELHALYSSPNIIRNLKSRRLRWAGHVARMGESRNAYRVLVGRPEGKRPLGRPRRRWEDNIKMDLREVGYDDRDWINLAQDRDRWRAYVRGAMNLREEEKELAESLVEKKLPTEDALEGMVNGRRVRGRRRYQMIDDIKIYGSYAETKRKAENWKDWRMLALQLLVKEDNPYINQTNNLHAEVTDSLRHLPINANDIGTVNPRNIRKQLRVTSYNQWSALPGKGICLGALRIQDNTFALMSDAAEICHVHDALTSWYTSSQTTHPPVHPEFQKQWDAIFSQKILDKLLSSFKSEKDIAHLLALQESESGDWLHALPSPHIGTLIDSTSFKIAMALRLGCKLCQPHQCICGGIADIYGHHALSCARSKGHIPRHTSLNDIIKRSLTSCGIPFLLEPPGISRADGKRAGGLTLIPWSRGKSLIWDSTCVDTLAPSHLPNTSRRAASAAELAVKNTIFCVVLHSPVTSSLLAPNIFLYVFLYMLSSSLLSKNLKVRIYKTVILPVFLYGCETWTITLREEHRLRVFENKVLRKIFGAKRDEVTGEWRKLHNAELHSLYSSPDIIRNIKSRRLRWAGHVARMGESRNAYRMLVGRPEGKRLLGRPRRRWEDNIKMDLKEVGYDDREWINLAQDREAYVRAAMNLRIPYKPFVNSSSSSDDEVMCSVVCFFIFIRPSSRSNSMMWSHFQRNNWAVLLRRDCQGGEIPANVGNHDSSLNDLFQNENWFYFQQDGTPAHFHVNVRNFLDRTLNQRWIGRRESAAEFPSRSPDLTSPDLHLWRALKNTVYVTEPQILEELRVQIELACNDIPLAKIQLICRSVVRRRWDCTVAEEDILNMHGLKEYKNSKIVFLSHLVAEK
ncbi:hypothetical protein ANN_13670 [Periplaneta americana]|uniref:Uncharacterized protein n=1 Tax=Periplaneta americana TaxID=6978 RepID=A0ABQ8TK17_PERAM|nr:hypothetical protein ANN_13670 [Periplaneta americana]